MIIRFFKSNQPASIIVIPLICIVMWLPSFIKPHPIDFSAAMPLFDQLTRWLIDFPRIAALFGILLVISEAFLLNYIVNENEVLNKQTYLPALMYIVLLSCSPVLLRLHPLLFSNLFLMLSINKLFGTYRQNTAFSQVFDSAFFVGLATLFYLPALVFFPVIWLSLLALRPFIWREWIIALIGLITPFFFILAYYYLIDKLDLFGYRLAATGTFDLFLPYKITGGGKFLISVLGLLFILSVLKVIIGLEGSKIKTKRTLLVLMVFMFIAIIITKFSYQHSAVSFSAFFIPFSVFTANYFLTIKRPWIAEVFFILLIAAIITTYFIN